MSRKNKTKPSAPPPASSDAPIALPRAGHYKESIEHFKELLKRERRADWLQGLAAAYAGRAEQLASKGMVVEALALWRTRAQACGVPLLDGPYIGWLVQTGQTQQALALLPQLAQLPAAERESVRLRLAPALLAAPEQVLAGLPEEDRLCCVAARAALAACTGGDSAALDAALPAISFRSPYRDLRPLLKAASLLGTDRAGAAAALARVPASGAFEALAAALRVCLLPRGEWLAGLRTLDDAGRALVLELEGCPPAQRAFVLELATRGPAPAQPLELLDLLLRRRRDLPAGFVRRSALQLLPHAPQRLDALGAAGLAPTVAERERALALAAESKQRPDVAEDHWLRLVDLLATTPADGPQRAAAVLRRLADQHASHATDGVLCGDARDWLARCAELDPADRTAPLRLVRSARADGDLKEARQLLDAARARFPDDTPLLLEAVETALAAGSFKKAAGLAKQVLQSDPINPQVRSLIGQAHLSHARKQIGGNNPAAAQRELDEAANWLRGGSERGVLTLLRGLATEPAAGDALLRQAVAELGGPLVGAFHLLLETRRVKHPAAAAPVKLLDRAGIAVDATPTAAEVVAFARALNALRPDDAALRSAIGVLGPLLERAATGVELAESEHLLVCEALHRQHLSALTGLFATAALARWHERPVFVYLQAAARYGHSPWTMPPREWDRLDRIHDQAQGQGDQRTAQRLSRLLADAQGRSRWAEDDDDDDDEPDIDRMAEELGGDKAFLDDVRRKIGAPLFEQLRRASKGDPAQLVRALVELLGSGFVPGASPLPGARPRRRRPAGAPDQKDLFND